MKVSLLYQFTFLLCLSSSSLLAQHHQNAKVDPDERNNYIQLVVKSVSGLDPDTVENKVHLRSRDKDGLLYQKYRVIRSGLICFDSGDWVYIKLHSSHDNESIGDIAIALDNDGDLFINSGHVCGGLTSFECLGDTIYTSAKEFFKYFTDDIDEMSWQPLNR